MKIKFLGAIGTVTGSSYLLKTEESNVLIDFGLYQEENADNTEMAFDPKDIDFVLLTHAHIDHVGRIPFLFKKGFKGRVYCTRETFELSKIMLEDSATIQQRSIDALNEDREKAGLDLKEPLYDLDDVELSLAYFYPVDFNTEITHENIEFTMVPSGHILGAATLHVKVHENNYHESICFSGDLGNKGNLLLDPPEFNGSCDYLLLEATYGNRLHKDIHARSETLGNLLMKTLKHKEKTIIPSFSVGRTQNLILEIKNLLKNKNYESLKSLPIYVDSPLGLKATEIYEENQQALKKSLQHVSDLFSLSNVHYLNDLKETFSIINKEGPYVVISSSGMCNGGKILFYLKELMGQERTNIVFIGYQAEGTLGRALLEKEPTVRLNDKSYPVKAQIHKINGYSAHGDQLDLLNFVKGLDKKPDIIFITHGEDDARNTLKDLLTENGHKNIFIPSKNKEFQL